MTSHRFRLLLAQNRLRRRTLAGFVHWDERLVRRWASGKVAIPDEVGTWLEAFCAVMGRRPKWNDGWPAFEGEAPRAL